MQHTHTTLLPGCAGTHDGALQRAARLIDSLGFNATSEDPFLPNAAVLRSAEAIDAVANAGRSGVSAESATASAGYILCSIVQLGGVIYVLWIVCIAILLLAFLPCVNFLFQLCFDTTVAVASTAAARGRRRARRRQATTTTTTTSTRFDDDSLLDFALVDVPQQQQRRRALQQQPPQRTGAFRGFADRVVALASHTANLGVPPPSAASDTEQQQLLMQQQQSLLARTRARGVAAP